MLRQMDGILFFRILGCVGEAVVFLPVCRGVRPLPQKKQMYFSIAWRIWEGEQTNKTKTTSVLEPEMSKYLIHYPPAFSLLESSSLLQNRDDRYSRSTVLVSGTDLGLVKQSESLKLATCHKYKILQCTWCSQLNTALDGLEANVDVRKNLDILPWDTG